MDKRGSEAGSIVPSVYRGTYMCGMEWNLLARVRASLNCFLAYIYICDAFVLFVSKVVLIVVGFFFLSSFKDDHLYEYGALDRSICSSRSVQPVAWTERNECDEKAQNDKSCYKPAYIGRRDYIQEVVT